MRNKITLLSILVFLLTTSVGWAQITVSGVVKAAGSGEPVPGAAVVEKGTTNGAVTNADGKFDIRVASANSVLVISSMGMITQEVKASSSFLTITMQMSTEQLQELVVTALGFEREKRSLAYSVAEVSGAEIKNSGEVNMVSGIAAKAAGVQVTNSSGAAGAASYIKIRGNASFTANDNQPLFVVDGVPIDNSQLNTQDLRDGVSLSNRAIDINPDDIESVNVLKGGAAAALYGTRGANGVILITTKKGGFNQPFQIDFNSSTEFLQVNKMPGLQTGYGQGFEGQPLTFGQPLSQFSWGPAIGESFDNAGDFFRTGYRYNNGLSFSGGNKQTSYFVSIGNLREDGIIPLNNFNRTTVRTAGSARVNDKLKLSSSINYTNSGGRRIQQGSNTSGLMLGLLRTPPSFRNSNGVSDPTDPAAFLNPDGTQRRYFAGYDNPYWTINNNPHNDNVNRLQGYLQADYAVNDWLSFMYRLGADNYTDRRTTIIARQSRTAVNGRMFEDTYTWSEWNSDLVANARKSFGKFDLNVLAGWNINQRHLDNVFVQGDGFAIENFYNLSNAANIISTQGVSRRRLAGLYSEVSLGWNDEFYVNVTARGDQASTFGDVSQVIFYPSVSGTWVITERLVKPNDILTFGKFRASYASVGLEPGFGSNRTYFNQASSLSGWIDGIQFPFGGVTGFTQSNVLGNPNLRPEYTNTTEFGFDLSFFKSRLNVDFTWYNQQSRDLIVAVPIAGSTGYTSSFQNVGRMENKGVELSINADVVKSGDLKWNVGMVYTRYRNKVLELAPGVDNINLPWGFFGANQRLVVGEAYGTLYGDDWERDANGNALVDANGYPKYSSTEVVVGNPNPDWLMGINSTLTYKNFSLYMLWDIRQGGDIWNGTRGALDYFGTSAASGENRNQDYVWTDVVTGNNGVYEPNTVIDGVDVSGQPNTTMIPNNEYSNAFGPLSGFTGASRAYIEDGSWVRLRQLTLTYTLPTAMFEKSKSIKGLTLSFTGRNLLLFTDYQGIDPETNLSGSTNSQGADYFNMPNTKGFIFSLKANF